MSGLQGLIDITFYAIVGLALSIAGFFFVMGVVSYMGAGGDQQKVQQGVAGMRNALIGAVLIGGAGLIINFVILDIVRPAGGEVGNIGQGLDCDNLLQQQLLASPLATANKDNANAVISGIQAQRPSDCPPDTWNPWVTSTRVLVHLLSMCRPLFRQIVAPVSTRRSGTRRGATAWVTSVLTLVVPRMGLSVVLRLLAL